MYIENMNMIKARNEISPHYESIIDFFESLQVGNLLTDSNDLKFKYSSLFYHWELEITEKNKSFSVHCAKNQNRILISFLSSTSTNIMPAEEKQLLEDFELNYNINKEDSYLKNFRSPNKGIDLFGDFEFNDTPTIEQISGVFVQLFEKEWK